MNAPVAPPLMEKVAVRDLRFYYGVNLALKSITVPLYRNHVFAQIKPATNTRIDFGYALGDTKATGRLIDTGGFKKKDRITHRIPISSLEEIDAEVKKWLRIAYDRDA